MLTITVPARELYDDVAEEFVTTKETTLQLEHSLISISKWESKWHIPFLNTPEMTPDQMYDYIRCMSIKDNVDPVTYRCLTSDNVRQIQEYISDPMTATTVNERNSKPHGREIITSEVLYYQMIALTIPFECQKWHLNRLLMLIKVCAIKNQPPKKMGKHELASRNRALNAARRQQYHTKG